MITGRLSRVCLPAFRSSQDAQADSIGPILRQRFDEQDALAMRRPSRFTAVTSFESAALCAVITADVNAPAAAGGSCWACSAFKNPKKENI
jgi:hypothetical protein